MFFFSKLPTPSLGHSCGGGDFLPLPYGHRHLIFRYAFPLIVTKSMNPFQISSATLDFSPFGQIHWHGRRAVLISEETVSLPLPILGDNASMGI